MFANMGKIKKGHSYVREAGDTIATNGRVGHSVMTQ
jgi:hypothetical protein